MAYAAAAASASTASIEIRLDAVRFALAQKSQEDYVSSLQKEIETTKLGITGQMKAVLAAETAIIAEKVRLLDTGDITVEIDNISGTSRCEDKCEYCRDYPVQQLNPRYVDIKMALSSDTTCTDDDPTFNNYNVAVKAYNAAKDRLLELKQKYDYQMHQLQEIQNGQLDHVARILALAKRRCDTHYMHIYGLGEIKQTPDDMSSYDFYQLTIMWQLLEAGFTIKIQKDKVIKRIYCCSSIPSYYVEPEFWDYASVPPKKYPIKHIAFEYNCNCIPIHNEDNVVLISTATERSEEKMGDDILKTYLMSCLVIEKIPKA